MHAVLGCIVMYPNKELVQSDVGHHKACVSRSRLFQNSFVPRIIGPRHPHDVNEFDPILISQFSSWATGKDSSTTTIRAKIAEPAPAAVIARMVAIALTGLSKVVGPVSAYVTCLTAVAGEIQCYACSTIGICSTHTVCCSRTAYGVLEAVLVGTNSWDLSNSKLWQQQMKRGCENCRS